MAPFGHHCHNQDFGGGNGVNEKGLSKKHVMEGLDAALKRLKVDYVDLVFCHRPDPFTPTEAIVRAMTDAVRSGKATAWGTSEWSAQQITEAVWIAKSQGITADYIILEQSLHFDIGYLCRFTQ